MRLRKSFIATIGLALMLVMGSVAVIPTPALAQECSCFCTSDGGAKSQGTLGSVTACQEACNLVTEKMIVCAASLSQGPDRGPRCFTESQCTKAGERRQELCTNAGKQKCDLAGTTWSKVQARECVAPATYCFPKEEPFTLGLAIGNVQVVAGLEGYIRTGYNFLLGIAVTISIVFVMIGGLQYVLSATTGQTQGAKTRIQNAVVGLVLLFGTYIILFTVNPNLVSLAVPQFPMIKRVVLVDDQSCEQLRDVESFTIDEAATEDFQGNPKPNEEKCGNTSPVLLDNEGSPVAEGTTCRWSACPNLGEGCADLPSGPKCIKCEDVIGGFDSTLGLSDAIKPSSEVCESLSINKHDDSTDHWPEIQDQCYFTNDPWVIVDNWTYAAGLIAPVTGGFSLALGSGHIAEQAEQVWNSGVCARINIDCSEITSCKGYSDLEVSSGEANPAALKDLAIPLNSKNMSTVCLSDPCQVREKHGIKGCTYGVINVSLFGYGLYSEEACRNVE